MELVSRLVGAVIKANHDKDGIVWPKEIAPWYYNMMNLKLAMKIVTILV